MKDEIIKAMQANLGSAIRSSINRTCIIDYGIIKEIPSKGVVKVLISAAKSPSDIRMLTCPLATIASANCTIDIVPTVGDKVAVLFPRRYDSDMFDVLKEEVIYSPDVQGYNLFSGIAFLLNQVRTKNHKNIITVDKEEMKINLGYDKASDTTKINIDIKNDGNIIIDNTKAKITVDKDGNIILDAQNGKITVKNTAGGTLKELLNGLLDKVKALTTVGSPAKQAIDPASQAVLETYKTNVGNLLG